MPTKRILFTLEDVKKLIAEKHKIPIDEILFFMDGILLLEVFDDTFKVDDDTFLFQHEQDIE